MTNLFERLLAALTQEEKTALAELLNADRQRNISAGTPITNALIAEIADESGIEMQTILSFISENGIQTLEQAYNHSDVPDAIKQIIESKI